MSSSSAAVDIIPSPPSRRRSEEKDKNNNTNNAALVPAASVASGAAGSNNKSNLPPTKTKSSMSTSSSGTKRTSKSSTQLQQPQQQKASSRSTSQQEGQQYNHLHFPSTEQISSSISVLGMSSGDMDESKEQDQEEYQRQGTSTRKGGKKKGVAGNKSIGATSAEGILVPSIPVPALLYESKTRRLVEGMRSGVHWFLFVDTAFGHCYQRMIIVPGIETYDDIDTADNLLVSVSNNNDYKKKHNSTVPSSSSSSIKTNSVQIKKNLVDNNNVNKSTTRPGQQQQHAEAIVGEKRIDDAMAAAAAAAASTTAASALAPTQVKRMSVGTNSDHESDVDEDMDDFDEPDFPLPDFSKLVLPPSRQQQQQQLLPQHLTQQQRRLHQSMNSNSSTNNSYTRSPNSRASSSKRSLQSFESEDDSVRIHQTIALLAAKAEGRANNMDNSYQYNMNMDDNTQQEEVYELDDEDQDDDIDDFEDQADNNFEDDDEDNNNDNNNYDDEDDPPPATEYVWEPPPDNDKVPGRALNLPGGIHAGSNRRQSMASFESETDDFRIMEAINKIKARMGGGEIPTESKISPISAKEGTISYSAHSSPAKKAPPARTKSTQASSQDWASKLFVPPTPLAPDEQLALLAQNSVGSQEMNFIPDLVQNDPQDEGYEEDDNVQGHVPLEIIRRAPPRGRSFDTTQSSITFFPNGSFYMGSSSQDMLLNQQNLVLNNHNQHSDVSDKDIKPTTPSRYLSGRDFAPTTPSRAISSNQYGELAQISSPPPGAAMEYERGGVARSKSGDTFVSGTTFALVPATSRRAAKNSSGNSTHNKNSFRGSRRNRPIRSKSGDTFVSEHTFARSVTTEADSIVDSGHLPLSPIGGDKESSSSSDDDDTESFTGDYDDDDEDEQIRLDDEQSIDPIAVFASDNANKRDDERKSEDENSSDDNNKDKKSKVSNSAAAHSSSLRNSSFQHSVAPQDSRSTQISYASRHDSEKFGGKSLTSFTEAKEINGRRVEQPLSKGSTSAENRRRSGSSRKETGSSIKESSSRKPPPSASSSHKSQRKSKKPDTKDQSTIEKGSTASSSTAAAKAKLKRNGKKDVNTSKGATESIMQEENDSSIPSLATGFANAFGIGATNTLLQTPKYSAENPRMTAQFLQSLGSMGSSSDSSAAYTLGYGSSQNLDPANAASFMQFNLMTPDGVKVYGSGCETVDEEPTRIMAQSLLTAPIDEASEEGSLEDIKNSDDEGGKEATRDFLTAPKVFSQTIGKIGFKRKEGVSASFSEKDKKGSDKEKKKGFFSKASASFGPSSFNRSFGQLDGEESEALDLLHSE